MKIFLATSFEAKGLFHDCRALLVAAGHEVPDWTTHKSIRPYREHHGLTVQHAEENLDNIRTADCFVLISDPRCKSALVELGVALESRRGTGKPGIIVVGDGEHSMYYHHPSVRFVDDFNSVLDLVGETA